jgi:hypothetical protein
LQRFPADPPAWHFKVTALQTPEQQSEAWVATVHAVAVVLHVTQLLDVH